MAQLSILDMHRLIDQEIQSMGIFTYQGLESEEIDLQLNAQIDIFVEAVLDKYKNKVPRVGVKEGFQVDQVRLDDLRTIHIKDLNRTLTDYNTDGVKFTLPDDYSHHIKTKVISTYSCSENHKSVNKQITSSIRIGESENIDIMRADPIYKSTKESPLGELVNNTMYIYDDTSFTITSASIDYIQKPVVVKFNKDGNGDYTPTGSVDCNLPHTVQRTIIRMTAIHISTLIESNQQKISNLQAETV